MSKMRGDSEIHALSQFFAVRSGCDGIVLLTDDYESAIAHYPPSSMILLLQTPKSRLSKDEIDNLPDNVATISLKEASRSLLKNKVFVCTNYLEDKHYVYRSYGHSSIAAVSKNAVLSIWAVKSDSGWSTNKLKKMLHHNRTALVGWHNKSKLVAIDGRLSNVHEHRYPTLPVLAIVPQFNEIDIIEPVIMHLLGQGVNVHIIDNWSSDGSYEAAERLAKLNPKRISVERFPREISNKYEWAKILGRVTEVAKENSHYKWIISNDADEIRWSPWPGVSLQKAISFIDYVGFNIIDHTVFNFYPIKDGYRRGVDPVSFFSYGDFGHEGWHFMQLKTWQNNRATDIASSSGHLVKVPDPKIFPLKFLLAHYSLRSNAQASKKVFKDRKPRFLSSEKKQGWHSHYDKISNEDSFIKPKERLITFSRTNRFLEKYLIERISGLGIKINRIVQK